MYYRGVQENLLRVRNNFNLKIFANREHNLRSNNMRVVITVKKRLILTFDY